MLEKEVQLKRFFSREAYTLNCRQNDEHAGAHIYYFLWKESIVFIRLIHNG